MRYAIISDVHANRQALQAVLTDIRSQDVDEIISLGDLVGYGPSPAVVLEKAYTSIHHFVMGNHDAVIAGKMSADRFNDNAREIIEWTAANLDNKAVDFFACQPLVIKGNNVRFVHGDLVNPGRFGYIFDEADAELAFEHCGEQLFFLGHSHVPGIFVIGDSGEAHALQPQDFCLEDGKRYIVNVGSVGQPRDHDFRSSYCLFDTDTNDVIFRKIPFDIDGFREDLRRHSLPESSCRFLGLADEKTETPVRELIDFSPPDQDGFVEADREVVDLAKTVSSMRRLIAILVFLFICASLTALVLGMNYLDGDDSDGVVYAASNDTVIPRPDADREILNMPRRTGAVTSQSQLNDWSVSVTDPEEQAISVELDEKSAGQVVFRYKSSTDEPLLLSSRPVTAVKGDRFKMSASFKKVDLAPDDIIYFMVRFKPASGNSIDLSCKTFNDNKNFRSGKWSYVTCTTKEAIPEDGHVYLAVKSRSSGQFLMKKLSLRRVE